MFSANAPEIYRQYAYLSITGYGPSDDITKILKITPSDEWSEGDPWKDKLPNEKRFFTRWRLNSGLKETEGLNAHIRVLLRNFRRKRLELLSLTGKYDVKVVCVSYNLQSFSFELDFELQRMLTDFGLRLWFDAYIDHHAHETIADLRQQLSQYQK